MKAAVLESTGQVRGSVLRHGYGLKRHFDSAELQKGPELIMSSVSAAGEVRKIISSVQIGQDETISYREYFFSSLNHSEFFSEENLCMQPFSTSV